MALRALEFDFDGLIVDTESSSFELARELYERRGVELPTALWRRCVGSHLDPYEHLQQVIGPGRRHRRAARRVERQASPHRRAAWSSRRRCRAAGGGGRGRRAAG